MYVVCMFFVFCQAIDIKIACSYLSHRKLGTLFEMWRNIVSYDLEKKMLLNVDFNIHFQIFCNIQNFCITVEA